MNNENNEPELKSSRTMNWILIILLCIGALAVVMAFTNPSPAKHRQAVAQALSKTTANLDDKAVICWDLQKSANGPVTEQQLEKDLSVKDFKLCSVGTLNRQGKPVNVSLGMFGHVFCTGI